MHGTKCRSAVYLVLFCRIYVYSQLLSDARFTRRDFPPKHDERDPAKIIVSFLRWL